MDQLDGGEEQREAQRSRAYHRGQRARALKEAGRVWLEPHTRCPLALRQERG